MNSKAIDNFNCIRWWHIFIPLSIIFLIISFLAFNNALNETQYVHIQQDLFYFLNKKLSAFPFWQFNLTQLGDTLILLAFLSPFLIFMPRFWEALIMGALLTLLFSGILKHFIDIPRPANIFDNQTFTIIGERAVGYSSCPSGHSMTILQAMTTLMVALLPKTFIHRVLWCVFILLFGFSVAFSRVAVGAHHPLDVLIGSSLGGLAGLLGIIITNKFRIFSWFSHRRYYPFFILVFCVGLGLICFDIFKMNLPIQYIAFTFLLVTLTLIIRFYVQKNKN